MFVIFRDDLVSLLTKFGRASLSCWHQKTGVMVPGGTSFQQPREEVRSSESNTDPNHGGPNINNEYSYSYTRHSTIDTSGLIMLPLRVTEAQIEVKVMSRHKRSPTEVIIYRLGNHHQVGSGALYSSRENTTEFFSRSCVGSDCG
jgi:hypothetical protein